MATFSDETLLQWHRVQLCFGRLIDIYKGNQQGWSDAYELDVRNFFLHCYHLTDYFEQIEGDDRAAFAYAQANPALAVCRDLCTNFKHAKMTKSKEHSPGGEHLRLGDQTFQGNENAGHGWNMAFEISTSGASYDALDLARQCVRAWENYGLPHRVEGDFPIAGTGPRPTLP